MTRRTTIVLTAIAVVILGGVTVAAIVGGDLAGLVVAGILFLLSLIALLTALRTDPDSRAERSDRRR